jgi:probable aminopeptidase NPEPL1
VAKLTHARTVNSALKGADTVLFLAPEGQLRAGWLTKVVSAPWIRLLARAAAEPKAGKLIAAENPDAGPARVFLGVLPDEVSRHNCPARSVAADALIKSAALTEGSVAVILCLEEPEHGLPLARAVGRMLPLYSRNTEKTPALRVRLAGAAPDGKARALKPADAQIVDRARWAASLVDMPTAEMNTVDFVRATRKAARGIANLRVSVLSGDEVLRAGLGGLHAVGRTGVQPPKLLLLHYRPPKSTRLAALIGKGIVYDTGGLSIKSAVGMSGMKMDMGGAAGVVGAALAMAASRTKQAFVAAAALAENAIGPDAYRPDDILAMHSGKTVEINNTDAEGRLVVADAASYVARKFKPYVLIDMATLTGAQLISTGLRHAAVVSNREGLERAAIAAGRASGDLAFPLPFGPELYQREFRSEVADMRNSVADRMNAQSSCAAQFIYHHVSDLDLPWLHVDMAGPSGHGGRATGYGVALLAVLLRSLKVKELTS